MDRRRPVVSSLRPFLSLCSVTFFPLRVSLSGLSSTLHLQSETDYQPISHTSLHTFSLLFSAFILATPHRGHSLFNAALYVGDETTWHWMNMYLVEGFLALSIATLCTSLAGSTLVLSLSVGRCSVHGAVVSVRCCVCLLVGFFERE